MLLTPEYSPARPAARRRVPRGSWAHPLPPPALGLRPRPVGEGRWRRPGWVTGPWREEPCAGSSRQVLSLRHSPRRVRALPAPAPPDASVAGPFQVPRVWPDGRPCLGRCGPRAQAPRPPSVAALGPLGAGPAQSRPEPGCFSLGGRSQSVLAGGCRASRVGCLLLRVTDRQLLTDRRARVPIQSDGWVARSTPCPPVNRTSASTCISGEQGAGPQRTRTRRQPTDRAPLLPAPPGAGRVLGAPRGAGRGSPPGSQAPLREAAPWPWRGCWNLTWLLGGLCSLSLLGATCTPQSQSPRRRRQRTLLGPARVR